MTRRISPAPTPSPKPTAAPTDEVAAKKQVLAKNKVAESPQPASNADVFDTVRGKSNAFTAETTARGHLASRGPFEDVADGRSVQITANEDDPFVRPNGLEQMPIEDFTLDANGKPIGLEGPRVKIQDDPVIAFYENNKWRPFANNPFAETKPNADGNFVFPDEERFPFLGAKVDAEGKPILDEHGLEQWAPRSLHSARTIAFEAANDVSHAMDEWSGRPTVWGTNGQLRINTHAFAGLNANFDAQANMLKFGVKRYKLPGDTEYRMFEVASSRETVAHEAGHALHSDLKPNRIPGDPNYSYWGESFGDQVAMWSSLRDPDRVAQLLQETGGDFTKPNALSAICEAWGKVWDGDNGEDKPLRDSVNDAKISTTTDEVHDRSNVFTGASYKLFLAVYQDQLAQGLPPEKALPAAGEIMGTFLARSTDYTPENLMTLEDVGMAYLKVDKEYFGGKFHDLLVSELERREIFRKAGPDNLSSADAWAKGHEAAIPKLTLAQPSTPASVDELVQANLGKLGIGPQLGLKLQSAQTIASGETIVRVQLTRGRGPGAQPLATHGVLVFRKDGTLADYQRVMPKGLSEAAAIALLDEAKKAGLDQRGTVGFVPKEGGGWRPWVVVPNKPSPSKGPNLNAAPFTVYDLEHLDGRPLQDGHMHGEGCGCAEKLIKGLLPPGAQLESP